MKLILLAFGLAATTVNAAGNELFSRAKPRECTDGIQDGGGPCAYVVRCNTYGFQFDPPIAQIVVDSLGDCLTNCTAYPIDHEEGCGSVDYYKETKTCSLFESTGFNRVKKRKAYHSASLYTCHG